jgi:hypothetical protein
MHLIEHFKLEQLNRCNCQDIDLYLLISIRTSKRNTMFEESLRGVAPLQALGVGIGLFLTGFFVRRRYFSPLSDIPGPFVASFTSSLWQLWQIAKGHTEAAVIELHQKHGITARIPHIAQLLTT